MRALITGASGFVGRHLSRKLREDGHFVVDMVRDYTFPKVAITVICDDLSLPLLERTIAEYEIDTVFHLAAQAQVSVAKQDPIGTIRSNVLGTANVLEACRRQKVGRLVCASSDKSYADGPSPYVEEQPLQAQGIYATSKACGDLLAQSYIREFNIPVAITRCGNIYGPGNFNRSTIIGGSIFSILEGKSPVIRSDGSPKRDYLYIDDAVVGYIALAKSDFVGPLNFGTMKPSSVIDVVNSILRIMGSDLQPIIQNTAVGEIQEQWLNSSLAKSVLAWEPSVPLDLGLAKTVDWYKANFLNTTVI